MKFAGLILICASSCLALILPAVGVVKFPKLHRQGNPTTHFPIPNAINHSDAHPVSTSSNGWMPYRAPANELLPNNVQTPFPNPAPDSAGVGPAGQNRSISDVQLGMGIWLLLAPVCLLGLVLWTLGPTPSGSNSRTK